MGLSGKKFVEKYIWDLLIREIVVAPDGYALASKNVDVLVTHSYFVYCVVIVNALNTEFHSILLLIFDPTDYGWTLRIANLT